MALTSLALWYSSPRLVTCSGLFAVRVFYDLDASALFLSLYLITHPDVQHHHILL